MRITSRNLVLFLFWWILPWIFYLAAANPSLKFIAHKLTSNDIKKLYEWVEVFQKEQKKFPQSLRELKSFVENKNQTLKIYDRYGYKFDMEYLDSKHFIVKSWASSSFKNKNARYAKNLFYSSTDWDSLFPEVIHNYPKPPSLYQPAQLISSTSYDKKYTARLFVNSSTNKKTLVVVRNSNKKDPIFIHSDNQPEEFIWFPGSRLLVFSSDPLYSQKGPLHIYDVDHDELKTIKIDLKTSIDNKTTSTFTPYVAALGGAVEDKLYVYLIPYKLQPLVPSAIFDQNNLYEIQVTFPHGKFLAEAKKVNQKDKDGYSLKRVYSSPKVGRGDKLQRMWFDLKIYPDIEKTINIWQEFAILALEKNSPMLPYALVTLIDLYYRAKKEYIKTRKPGSIKLHGFALDYSKLVAQTPTYPTWLNLVGWGFWESIKEGKKPALSLITPVSREIK